MKNPTTLYAGWRFLVEYDVWINGVQVTSDNADNVLGDAEETVKYDPKSKTLTMNNAYLKKGYENKDHLCDICGTTLPDGGGDSDKDGKSGNGSGTGDDYNILPFAIAMVLALATAGAVITRRRMQRR